MFDTYNASIEISGLNSNTQLKEKIEIHSDELYPIIDHYYGKISEAIISIIQSSDPEVISDISQNGIYFYGGGCKMIGIEKYMSEKTTFRVNTPDVSKANVLGTGELIKYPQLLKKIIKNS